MTRKDYNQLAEELRIDLRTSPYANDPTWRSGFWAAVLCVMDALRRDNPRFDREKFIAAVKGDS